MAVRNEDSAALEGTSAGGPDYIVTTYTDARDPRDPGPSHKSCTKLHIVAAVLVLILIGDIVFMLITLLGSRISASGCPVSSLAIAASDDVDLMTQQSTTASGHVTPLTQDTSRYTVEFRRNRWRHPSCIRGSVHLPNVSYRADRVPDY